MNPLPVLRALRPQQWSKNLFVLAALVFAFGDRTAATALGTADVLRVLWALAAFCLGASAIYLINDVIDVESDRQHPEKRHRPIAAGQVSVPLALALCGLCAVCALALGWQAGAGAAHSRWAVLGVVAGYMALNFAYSFKLKRVVLVDVFCIAAGFVLRVEAGGLACGREVSHWLVLCTLFLALFLALNKRRAEIALLGDDSKSHRKILEAYSITFLDQLVTALAACTILCYTMYTVDPDTLAKFGSNHLLWSVPFVVFGVARYMLLVQTRGGGGNPTRVLLGGDALFLVNGLAWMAVVAAVVLMRH